jgi:hypothetical protein
VGTRPSERENGAGGESARRPRAGRFGAPVRGTSGLHRARCWVTPSRGNPQESATENRPPMAGPVAGRGPAQVRVKRCGKSAPASGATRAARQTPPGARPRRGRTARPQTPPGRPLEPAGNRRPRGMAATDGSPEPSGQNPAYRPTRHHLRSDRTNAPGRTNYSPRLSRAGPTGVGQRTAELLPGTDAELGEDLAQVPLHRSGADE